MNKNEEKVKRDVEKYLDSLKHFLKKYPKGKKIKLGNPNDKHLRTYVKNWYYIKLSEIIINSYLL